jgi:hypothetical protein
MVMPKEIAWWATGNYTNTRKVDTHFILMVPPEKMILRNISPKSFGSKPEWNFVYSANNQPS